MDIDDFLTPDRIALEVRVRDKAALIAEIARLFGRTAPKLHPETVHAALQAREQLGSTGLGGGFALPHARIEGLDAYLGLFLRLARPIDFEAIDGKPVQLVFVLLIPSESATPHVAALAAISRRFRNADVVTRLQKAKTPVEAYGILTTN
jgi:PTS system nitrogen regulatory IIA component